MKLALVVAAFAGLVGRCSELDLPIDHPWHDHGHHPPPPAADDDAGVDDEEHCGPPGLYADRACKHLERGIVPYTPSYELWADGADKQRFIYLPADAQIDTSDPDRWTFPVGTRVYKTFSLNGKKLETRVFEKTAEPADIGNWTTIAYAWREDQRNVDAVGPEGAKDVLGTEHDVPTRAECKRCHDQSLADMPPVDILNGFEAIQLNHGGRGWTLERLIENDRLTNLAGTAPDVTLDDARVPGSREDQAALGYLHANCGNCHGGGAPRGGLDLSVRVDNSALSDAPAYKVAAACTVLARWKGRFNKADEPYLLTIEPGAAATSGIIGRMSLRDDPKADPPTRNQMPPIGTEHVDHDGIQVVSHWIDQLQLHCELPTP